MKVEEMEAGPGLDQIVATVVMGVRHHFEDQTHWITVNGKLLSNWHPSTDIRDAWEVVSKLAAAGYQIRLSNKAMDNAYWWCYMDSPGGMNGTAQGSTAQEAICRAAIKIPQK